MEVQTGFITLNVIAKRAGVSKATVSNVLHRNHMGTRADAVRNASRIRQIADELGYRPNLAARAIQTRRYNAIGLLASNNPEVSIYHHFLSGLTRQCHAHDLHLNLGEVHDQELTDESYVPKILREWSVDGLLIAYTHNFPPKLRELVDRHAIPSVWLNVKKETDCVFPDDRGGIAMVTEHLVKLGHRRIAFVNTYPTQHYSAQDRFEGYRKAMKAAGLSPFSLYGHLKTSVAMSQLNADVRQLLRQPDRPTAFVAYHAPHATTVFHAAVSLGMDVPADLSIIGTAGEPIDAIGRDISTLVMPGEAIGELAVDMLVRKIASPKVALEPGMVSCVFKRPDASTGPPPNILDKHHDR